MLRKLLAALLLTALGCAPAPSAAAVPTYSPYATEQTNRIYNLMFCDDVTAFLAAPGKTPTSWQSTLSTPSDIPALQALAADRKQEGRIRYLAYQQLRRGGHPVLAKQLLGIIVEMPQDKGLDTLAAFAEGGVRYINQSGKMCFIEGGPPSPQLEALFITAQPLVDAIGPWDKARRGPPDRGQVRMTFLVSDGLYFVEGPASQVQKERMPAAVLAATLPLLQTVMAATSSQK